MNETLRRALVHARLSEEDVASHLQVDPKTVRRWLEGRTPYLRHRWALSALLGLDEADLWPQLRTGRSRPEEIKAIYPHVESVPQDVWQHFFQSAHREIDILTDDCMLLNEHPVILSVLRDRALADVQIRICQRDPDSLAEGRTATCLRETIARCAELRPSGDAKIRLHPDTLSSVIYRADEQLIISQRAFGIPARLSPALLLRRTAGESDLFTTYQESFEHAWVRALPTA